MWCSTNWENLLLICILFIQKLINKYTSWHKWKFSLLSIYYHHWSETDIEKISIMTNSSWYRVFYTRKWKVSRFSFNFEALHHTWTYKSVRRQTFIQGFCEITFFVNFLNLHTKSFSRGQTILETLLDLICDMAKVLRLYEKHNWFPSYGQLASLHKTPCGRSFCFQKMPNGQLYKWKIGLVNTSSSHYSNYHF